MVVVQIVRGKKRFRKLATPRVYFVVFFFFLSILVGACIHKISFELDDDSQREQTRTLLITIYTATGYGRRELVIIIIIIWKSNAAVDQFSAGGRERHLVKNLNPFSPGSTMFASWLACFIAGLGPGGPRPSYAYQQKPWRFPILGIGGGGPLTRLCNLAQPPIPSVPPPHPLLTILPQRNNVLVVHLYVSPGPGSHISVP